MRSVVMSILGLYTCVIDGTWTILNQKYLFLSNNNNEILFLLLMYTVLTMTIVFLHTKCTKCTFITCVCMCIYYRTHVMCMSCNMWLCMSNGSCEVGKDGGVVLLKRTGGEMGFSWMSFFTGCDRTIKKGFYLKLLCF